MAEETTLPEPSELDLLKQRAKLMEIPFRENIGVEALKAKIAEATAPKKEASLEPKPSETIEQARKRVHDEALKLVRCRITCLNPNKSELHGEFFTIANNLIGTVKKFVPYDEAGESYHLPYCIYKHLKSRKYLDIRTSKPNHHSQQIVIQRKWVPEFSIERLPDLTNKELKELAAAQAAAGSIDRSNANEL